MVSRFNIGDQAWFATFDAEPAWVECPDCGGTGRIRCLLPDDSMVSIECECCRRGYEGPLGKLQVYVRTPRARFVTITGVEMQGEKVEWRTDSFWCAEDDRLFAAEADAFAKAKAIADDMDRLERERIQAKEKDTKSWAWNVHYHRREIREAEKRIAYHRSKLAVASLKAKEPATEAGRAAPEGQPPMTNHHKENHMTIKGQYRQGDVLVERTGDAPADIAAGEPPILAEGEVSGHLHRVFGGAVMFRDDGLARDLEAAYIGTLDVPAGGAELRHVLSDGQPTGEHDTIALASGRHIVVPQREYDPEGESRAAD